MSNNYKKTKPSNPVNSFMYMGPIMELTGNDKIYSRPLYLDGFQSGQRKISIDKLVFSNLKNKELNNKMDQLD